MDEDKLTEMSKRIVEEISKTNTLDNTTLAFFQVIENHIPGFLGVITKFSVIFLEYLNTGDFSKFVKDTMDLVAYVDENTERRER